jgi:16S rRNA (guanine527-N7)-methyltransferase
MDAAEFRRELHAVLPEDLPNRQNVIEKGAEHLNLVMEVNERMNLTRIEEPRQAAIKHVLDSVMPWPRVAPHKRLLDAGSGAGFPGIPLALVFPEKQFVLAESVGKKARFLEEAVHTLGLNNVTVRPERAEQVLKTERFDAVVLRAVAPTKDLLKLLKPVARNAGALILYKGSSAERELAEAGSGFTISFRYELPDAAGTRAIIERQRS